MHKPRENMHFDWETDIWGEKQYYRLHYCYPMHKLNQGPNTMRIRTHHGKWYMFFNEYDTEVEYCPFCGVELGE